MHHEKQLIFGMGAGECGLGLLNEILSRQQNCQSTLDQAPLLPWESPTANRLIQERINRLSNKSDVNFVADMADFYLPYVQAAIEHCANVRFICLKRPKLESISAMCHQLDQSSPRALNHWASDVSGPWSHDFLTSRSYPKFDTNNRFEGVSQYWEQYYETVDQLCAQYPDNIQVWDTEDLTTETGVSEVLSFAGIPVEDQVIITGQRPASASLTPEQINSPRSHRYPNKNDPRRCVILVPYQGLIHRECEEALKELERRGYPVRRVSGYAAIDQGRNQLATDALIDGYEEVIWVDSDVAFHPDSIDQLRSHPHEIVCGIYPQKNKRALASHVMPGSKSLTFGKEG